MQCNLFVGVCILPIFAAGSQKMVAIAQLVRVSDCDSEGRGFEPHWLPDKTRFMTGIFILTPLKFRLLKNKKLPLIRSVFRKTGLTKHYSKCYV